MPTTTILNDIDGIFPWNTIETTFDDLGTILNRSTILDNGIHRLISFDGGIISQKVVRDNSDAFYQPPVDAGVKPWNEIVTSYDQNGVITARDTTFDNGVGRFVQFENGARTLKVLLDNYAVAETPPADGGVKTWEQIIVAYDADGLVNSRDTTFDNGVTRFEGFVNGVPNITVEQDNIVSPDGLPADGGAKAWTSRITQFDENGLISERSIDFDNGVNQVDFFDGGVRAFTVKQDNFDFGEAPPADGGAKNWAEIFKFYDAEGQLASSERVLDNGDVIIFNFENGERTNRVDIDVNNDQSWLVRETSFGECGNDVVTYDTMDALPELYLAYFDEPFV